MFLHFFKDSNKLSPKKSFSSDGILLETDESLNGDTISLALPVWLRQNIYFQIKFMKK